MFDYVLGRGVPKRRFGAGALLGLPLFGALVAGVLSLKVEAPPPPPDDDLRWPTVIPTGGMPKAPRSGAGKARGERQPINRPRPPVVVGADVRLTILAHQEEPPPRTTATSGDGLLREDDAEGRGDGEQSSGERGPCTGGDCGQSAEYGLKCSDESPCSMGSNLSPPVLLEGSAPQYTKEALAAGVEGMMEVSCVLTREGTVRDCAVEKSVPLMEAAVVKALTSRRYIPAKLLGEPVAVQYQFHVRLVLPEGEGVKKVAPPSAPIPL
jgi:periplasmic protein TonB